MDRFVLKCQEESYDTCCLLLDNCTVENQTLLPKRKKENVLFIIFSKRKLKGIPTIKNFAAWDNSVICFMGLINIHTTLLFLYIMEFVKNQNSSL